MGEAKLHTTLFYMLRIARIAKTLLHMVSRDRSEHWGVEVEG